MSDELVRVAEDSARGGFFLISGTAVSTVILAITAILVGRFLGPELYGQYTLALVVPTLLFIFTDLGINQGIIKFTASLRLKGEINRITKIIKYGLLLRASTGIVIFIINYAFADVFASVLLQRPELAFYMRIVSTSLLFQVISSIAVSTFVGLDKTEYNAITTNTNAVAKAIISVTLILLGFSVAGALVGYVLAQIIASVVGISILFFLIRKMRTIQTNESVSKDLKNLLTYGAPLYITALVAGFSPLFQNIVLAIFTTDISIGNYRAAANFITFMATLSVPITTALLPAFSKLNSSHSSASQKVKSFFKLANKYTAIIIVPATFLIIIFSSDLVQIAYGSTYESAPTLLATYCPLYFLVGLGYLTLTSLYNGLGDTRTTLIISLIGFLTLAFLSPMFTQSYGVQGLIVAILIASTASTVYGSYTARKKFQIEFDIRALIKIYLISAISAVPSFLILHFANLPELFNVTIGGLLYVLIYVTLTPLTKIMTTSEIRTARRITQKTRLLGFVARPVLKYQQKILRIKANKANLQKL
jgi:stage V sporulation protein B